MPATPLTLAWVIVYLPDVERGLALYESAFGLTRRFLTPDGTYGELDTGATTLAFAHDSLGTDNFPGGPHRPSLEDRPANVELAFTAADVPEALARALEAGCLLLSDPVHKSHGQTVAYVRDPWGTLIELATPIDG